MKDGLLTSTVVLLLLISALFVAVPIRPAYASEWHVYPGQSIQEAINSASPGDTIYVHAGTYYENLVIDKSLTIKGASTPVIKGSGTFMTNYMGAPWTREAVIFVVNSTDVVLESLDIEGENLGPGYNDGVVYVYSSGEIRNCRVSPNTIGDMYSLGVEARASDLKVTRTTIENFGRIGVYFANCTGGVYSSTIIGQVYSDANQVNYGIEIEPHQGVRGPIEIIGNEIYNSDNTYLPEPTWSSAGIVIDAWKEYMDTPSSTVIIQHNNIHNNYYGIEAAANALSYAHYNNIYNNRKYGVISASDYLGNNATFDARYNWWGHETGPYHGTSWTYMGSPYGPHYGLGDNVSDYVLYDPWLTSAFVPPPIHDVAVSQLIATPTMVEIGGIVEIDVTVKNLGNVYETFDLTTNYGSIAQVEHIVDLEPGGERTFTYHWDTSGESTCFHTISALAHPVEGETYIYNNFRSVSVAIVSFIPEPATLKVEPSPAKGLREFEVNVTINELDTYWDMAGFDITLHYNTTMLDVVNVELGSFAVNYNLTFQIVKEVNDAEGYIHMAYMWDIAHLLPEERPTPSGSGVLFTIIFKVVAEGEDHLSFGDVTLAAFGNATKWCAETSIPIEHTTKDGIVRTMFPWKEDVNADGKINILDIVSAATAYASRPGDPNWNPYADINQDGVITILDIVSITRIYGITYDP